MQILSTVYSNRAYGQELQVKYEYNGDVYILKHRLETDEDRAMKVEQIVRNFHHRAEYRMTFEEEKAMEIWADQLAKEVKGGRWD